MKALRLSTLVLLLASVFFACTKDTLSSQDSLASANKLGLLNETNNGGGRSDDVSPTLSIVFKNSNGEEITEATKGQPVTVYGTFAPEAGETAPTCGLLVIVQETAPDVWTRMTVKDAGGNDVTEIPVSAATQSISYTFTPDKTGDPAYNFQVEYKSNIAGEGRDGQCAGYKNSHSDEAPLKVVDNCLPLNLVVDDYDGTLREGTTDIYDFIVTYRVTSCPAMGKAHLQGGLTAVTGLTGFSTTDTDPNTKGEERKNTHNDNHIIMWDFNIGDDYDETFTVRFSKKLKGAAPYELTGTWSVSVKNPETGEEVRVEADPILFTPE